MANTVDFSMWYVSSACGVSSEHLNYKKYHMVKAVYRFQMYYHVRRILKRLQVPLPHEAFLIIFTPVKNILKFVTTITFLMILRDTGMKNFIGPISEVLNGQTIT